MALKVTGLVLLAACGWLAGNGYAEEKSRAHNILVGFVSLAKHIAYAVEYSNTDIYTVIGSFSDKSLEECGFLSKLKSDSCIAVSKAWNEAVLLAKTDSETENALLFFGASLGVVDRMVQISNAENLAAFITEKDKSLYGTLKERSRSYRVLGMLCGCLAGLIIM